MDSTLTLRYRAHAFFMIHVCLLVLESISPPLGSLLMETIGPHYTWLAGIPLGLLGFLFLSYLPHNNISVTSESNICEPESTEQPALTTTPYGRMKQTVLGLASRLRQDLPKLFLSKSLFIGLMAMFIAKMTRPIKDLLSQFMTAKFEWPISRVRILLFLCSFRLRSNFLISQQANLIISLHAAAQLPWFIAVLPTANAWLLRWKGDAIQGNHTLAILLVSCLTLGALFVGLAPTSLSFIIGRCSSSWRQQTINCTYKQAAVIVYTGGSGFSIAMRSLLAALVADDQLSLLFTTIAVFEAAALLTAAPLLQLLFSAGLQHGGLAMSLPFFAVAVLYGIATLALSLCTFN